MANANKPKYICTLAKDINKCAYFDGIQHCNNPESKCGMRHTNNQTEKGYVRKDRWFEKYYK